MERKPVYAILGATGGIGSAVARALVASGSTVALAARDAGRLEALSAGTRRDGRPIFWMRQTPPRSNPS